MRYLYIFILSIIALSTSAQSQSQNEQGGYIEGSVFDRKTTEPIPFASIRLLNESDSSYVKGTASNDKAVFKISASPGKYIFEVSYIGYDKYYRDIQLSEEQLNVNLDKIYLDESSILLNEAVVEAKVPDIVVKGDTIEYSAAAYTNEENAMLQDMISNIPGIEVDANGNITANGKPVKKILVDGKEFFGNDIAMALNNLPANMIKKLQLFKEESETAKVTGFKDKNPEQVLNLVVKDELKQSIFGDIKLGYGSDEKYTNKAIVNYMRNDNQLSFVSNVSNVNASEMYFSDNGIDKNENAGVNYYSQASSKFKIGANVRIADNQNTMKTTTNTQTFLPGGDRLSKNESENKSNRKNFNAGVNLSWEPDSLTTIFFRSHLGFNKSDNLQTNNSLSYVADQDSTIGTSATFSKGTGYNLNNTLTIGRKLNQKGRTISLSISQILRDENSDGSNYSLTTYTGATPEKEIDQKTETQNKGYSYNISASYVEPINKVYSLQLAYSYNKNDSKRIKNTLRKDPLGNYNIVDSAYTRNTANDYLNQSISLNFQANKEKFNYTIGFSVDPSYSISDITLGDSVIDHMKQNVVNYSPSIHFSYMPSPSTNIDFDYSGSTSQPSISQLSPDTVIINALTKHYGNPGLRPSYDNNINMHLHKSDYEKSRFMMIAGGFRYTFSNIVSYTDIDAHGNTANTYRNIDGNMGANLSFMYDTPLRNKKFTFNTNSYAYYSKNIGFTNGEKAVTNNSTFSEQATIKFKSKNFETSLLGSVSHTITRNSLSKEQNRNTTNLGLKNNITLKLPFDFSIQSNLEYNYYDGYGADFKKSEILWNASVSKQFLKQKKGTMKLQFFDILNDRNTLSRYVNSNYISDSRSNTINRYFLFSFSYRFNIFKGKKSESTDSESDYM